MRGRKVPVIAIGPKETLVFSSLKDCAIAFNVKINVIKRLIDSGKLFIDGKTFFDYLY